MTACLFGTYNREHTANRIYASAIRAAGYRLVEYHVPLWERTRDKDAGYFSPLALFWGALEYAVAAVGLAARWLSSGGAPVAVVGFNGQLDVALLHLVSGRNRPRIVFAPLVSLTETLVDDRSVYREGSLMARVLAALDRLSCRLADVVIVDSEAHRRYFIERLGVDEQRLSVCHLGPDMDRVPAAEQPDEGGQGKREILWFGQYLPLHGLDVICDAVGRLAPRQDLRFTVIGGGPERGRIEPLLKATRADMEFIDWLPYDTLTTRIAGADLVLGIFGEGPKAAMVIPNKVYQAAAMGRAVITADTEAVRELFESERDILLCRPDGKSLAAAVARLIEDDELRAALGAEAARLMARRFADEATGTVWRRILSDGGAATERAEGAERLGVAILNFNDAAATLRSLETVVAAGYDNLSVLVVDNGSEQSDLAALEAGMAGRFGARLVPLPGNLGYAGANNKALELLFADGCDHVLILNNDTQVAPGSLAALVAAARRYPGSGPIGPTVTKDSPGARNASRGERYWAWLAWLPRSWLRYRLPRQTCYEVGGVTGCALLLSRRLWTELGGFDESYFAYYEEVDYCLRARSRGMKPRVEPAAEIAHRGHRGFGGGMSVVSAYLKARNLWRLVKPRLGYLSMPVFALGYTAMAVTSVVLYLARGRTRVAAAIVRGAFAGFRGEDGPPPAWTMAR